MRRDSADSEANGCILAANLGHCQVGNPHFIQKVTSGVTPFDHIPYHRLFPWLHLFRAIGLAFSFRQLLIAAGAICALWIGHAMVESIDVDQTPMEILGWTLPAWNAEAFGTSQSRAELTAVILRPWDDILRSSTAAWVPRDSLAHRLKAIFICGWSFAMWSIFGVALCRLAARRFTRQEEGSFRKAVQFGLSRSMQGVVAPALPAIAAVAVMVPTVLIAVSGNIPVIGSTLVTVLSPVILLCSLIAAALLIAVVVGWPLMLAAIGTDDCDGFGGLSRSYSLWTGRPWYFAWCLIVAAVVGTVVVLLANGLAQWAVYLATLVVMFGMGEGAPAFAISRTIHVLIVLLFKAYCISFFWTCAMIIYALLRQSVDGMPLDAMAADRDELPARDPLPVVGMPAMGDASIREAGV